MFLDYLTALFDSYDPNYEFEDDYENKFKYRDFNEKQNNLKFENELKRIENAKSTNRLFEVLTADKAYMNHDPFEPTENIAPPTFSTVEPYDGTEAKRLTAFLTLNAISPHSERIVNAINEINMAGDISIYGNKIH